MTPLRRRMSEDMPLRNFSPQAQRTYLHHIPGLARFYQTSPEHLNLEDHRQFQAYLASECRYSAESLNQLVSAAKFHYGVTLEAPFDVGALLRAYHSGRRASHAGLPAGFLCGPHRQEPRDGCPPL